jgi:hypothetical protein
LIELNKQAQVLEENHDEAIYSLIDEIFLGDRLPRPESKRLTVRGSLCLGFLPPAVAVVSQSPPCVHDKR